MKKKILFVNDEMTIGGVARILNTLLAKLDLNKYDIDLLVLHKHGGLLPEIPEGINVIEGSSFFDTIDYPLKECKGKDIFHKLRLIFYMKTGLIKKRIKKERKNILNKHYDVEFAAKEGFCTIFTSCGDSDRKLNWVQTDYKESNFSKHHMNLIKEALKEIDMNICCSNQVWQSYSELFEIENGVVIHNLLDEDRIKNLLKEKSSIKTDKERINLIAVARMHYQKGLDRLIKIYPQIENDYYLTIIGDGPQKEELFNLAKEYNVYDKIQWQGFSANPYPDIAEADLFILCSRYEGYPTIVPECLSSGTPILALEVSGVKEQILSEEEGFIVSNDDQAMLDKLIELKNKKVLLQSYKEKLKTYHYDNESIVKAYEELF